MARREPRIPPDALAWGHAERAMAAYAEYGEAHLAADAYEAAIVAREGSKEAGAQALSDTASPRDWTYRVLSGKRKWYYDLALLEGNMARMYAALATMERTGR